MTARRTATIFLALAAALLLALATGVAADVPGQFLVVQKMPARPENGDNDGESHVATHTSEVLKAVHAAFVTKPAPQAAVFVDAGPDPTLHGQSDGSKGSGGSKGRGNRRMLAEPVLMSPMHLAPRTVSLGGDAREMETKVQSLSSRAAKMARSMFLRPTDSTRIALAKANGDR